MITAFLDRFTTICHANPAIVAAFLYGSHARGAADPWSDIDLTLVVADAAYDTFLAGRDDFLRQLGEPLFIEDFDIPGLVFFILADGTEAELSFERESEFTEPYGPWRALFDKTGVVARARPRPTVDDAGQTETLRRQIMWFWHDLSHFMTALARGQLWWATGQLEILRRMGVTLARLSHDFADEDAVDDPTFKLDKSPAAGSLSPLRETFVPLEREALLAAARVIIRYYQDTAWPLADAHGLHYPVELEQLMLARLDQLGAAGVTLEST